MLPDAETCYAAMQSRDTRFDGAFFVAVATTKIYCRPSCPAKTPKRANVRFYTTAAAAQAAGYRACLRCRPDAVPGSPGWNLRSDVARRALRLVSDGVVDREGVEGLARRLAYSPRQLRRLLVDELGAGPLDLARAQRAHTARLLIETTSLPFAEIAFAAGFSSIRQFNDTVRAIFALTPRELRRRAARRRSGAGPPQQLGVVVLRLPFRAPLHSLGLLDFFAERALPGVEEVSDGTLRRTLRLPHAVGIAELTPRDGHVECLLRLGDVRDLAAAVERCRALLDLDADPVAVDEALGRDPLLAPLVARAPGRRVPGAVDGAEVAVRAVLGQQVSLKAARALAGRLSAALGIPVADPQGTLERTFPTPEAIAEAAPSLLRVPAGRRETVLTLARALVGGRLVLDPGADRDDVRRQLLELRGIGPWTAEYVAMRALRDADAFPLGDHGLARGLEALGEAGDRAAAARLAERWRPWRAYALQHLWAAAAATEPARG